MSIWRKHASTPWLRTSQHKHNNSPIMYGIVLLLLLPYEWWVYQSIITEHEVNCEEGLQGPNRATKHLLALDFEQKGALFGWLL